MRLLSKRSSRVKIRPLTSFQDLQGETGRAAESGGTIHIALGNGGLIGEDAVTSLAALEVVEELADTAILYNAPPIITVGDPTLLPLAQDTLRRAHERHGLVKRYNPNQVRFIAPSPVAYAAGAASVVMTENVMSNAMIGAFGPEVSLLVDAGARRNLPQLAAAASPDAIGALYPATDRLAVGEELYAAGAQMVEKGRYAISLQAQDILRLILAGFIAMTAALAFVVSLLP
ncbi:MAG: hypothetical protein JW918_06975 [Anaerolineae bacterium]|nr:hypothetical protein [Anaerolineae bacterium]